jgi:hypothetical protein
MSRAIFEAPTIRPSAFLIGEDLDRAPILAPSQGFVVVDMPAAMPRRVQ